MTGFASVHRFGRCKASENAGEMYLDSSVTLERSLLNRLRSQRRGVREAGRCLGKARDVFTIWYRAAGLVPAGSAEEAK